jgi:hypothetical protein
MHLGQFSAKEIREAGRALGLRGDKLTEYVNKALTDSAHARAAAGAVAVAALQSNGFVYDVATARKNSAQIKFVKPPELKSPMARAKQALAKMSDEERAEILALLKGATTAPAPTVDVTSTTTPAQS